MDGAVLAKSIGIGLAAGICTMGYATVVAIPVSYMMNKFIYHGSVMRLMLGLVAGMFALFLLVVMVVMFGLGKWKPVHYFGLAPILMAEGDPVAPSGWLSFLMTIFYAMTHPITMFYTGQEDVDGYKNTVRQLLVSESSPTTDFAITSGEPISCRKGAVCEEFSKAAREAGAIDNDDEWRGRMEELSATGVGKYIFF